MASETFSMSSLKTPPTLKEMAFAAIKESIINGALTPGGVYSELILAKQLGISKTPVREALINLEIRGFITIHPKRGFEVKKLLDKDIRDMYEFRGALEHAVIRHITPAISADQLNVLGAIVEDGGRPEQGGLKFLEQDIAFHRFLAELTTNEPIIAALDGIWDLCVWVNFGALTLEGCAAEAFAEHRELMDALSRRDLPSAQTAMTTHLGNNLDKVLKSRTLSPRTS